MVIVTEDSVFPGIVGRKHQRQIPVEQIHEVPQVADTAVYIVSRMKGVLNLKHRCRCRHELHQPPGAHGRDGTVIEV